MLALFGMELSEENMGNIGDVIEKCLSDKTFAEGRDKAREEGWAYPGHGAEHVAEYLMKKYETLKAKESGEG